MILEQLNMLESISDRESYTYRITHYLLENRHSIIEYKVNDILEDLDISKSTKEPTITPIRAKKPTRKIHHRLIEPIFFFTKFIISHSL